MRWEDTEANQCRYSECAEKIFKDMLIVWEESEANWQGYAEILAYNKGNFYYYRWDYGSCSGCDTWEAQMLSDDEIVCEMEKDMITFNLNEFYIWLNNLKRTDKNKYLSISCSLVECINIFIDALLKLRRIGGIQFD